MKRKSFYEFLSFPSKCRRLDCDVLEEPRSSVYEVLEPKQLAITGSNDGVLSPAAEERALVLYDLANTPFLRSPTSPDFAAILNSDLIPGLRDFFFWPGKSNRMKSLENKLATSKITEVSNKSLAVVPWVPSQVSLSQPMEAAAAEEMMDIDDISCIDTAGNTSEFGGNGMMIVTEGLQF